MVLLALGGTLAWAAVGRRSSGEAEDPIDADPQSRPVPAVVLNPTKETATQAKEQIREVCRSSGWQDPLWFETTAEDPGTGQARDALAQGADVVMALGGDGTVRAVAEGLAGSSTALGLLPAGTGNLLARNLDLPVDNLERSTAVALGGDDRPIDVGWVRLDDGEDEQAFLVMSGIGFDAEVMAQAPESLKSRMGPAAYVVAGLRRLNGPRVRARITVDDATRSRRVRSVIIGNCGKLVGGVVLMPDAKIDDGIIDVVSIAPRGVVGWSGVIGQVMTRQRRGHPRVEHWNTHQVVVETAEPMECQLDGDPVGKARTVTARVAHRALVVRVPAKSRRS